MLPGAHPQCGVPGLMPGDGDWDSAPGSFPGSWECEWWSCRLLEPPFPARGCLWGKPTPGAGICWPLPQSAGVSATPDRGEGPAVNWEPDPGLDVNPPARQSVQMWGASSRLRQITKCHFSQPPARLWPRPVWSCSWALHSWVLLLLPAGQPAAAPQHLPAQPHLSAPASPMSSLVLRLAPCTWPVSAQWGRSQAPPEAMCQALSPSCAGLPPIHKPGTGP